MDVIELRYFQKRSYFMLWSTLTHAEYWALVKCIYMCIYVFLQLFFFLFFDSIRTCMIACYSLSIPYVCACVYEFSMLNRCSSHPAHLRRLFFSKFSYHIPTIVAHLMGVHFCRRLPFFPKWGYDAIGSFADGAFSPFWLLSGLFFLTFHSFFLLFS